MTNMLMNLMSYKTVAENSCKIAVPHIEQTKNYLEEVENMTVTIYPAGNGDGDDTRGYVWKIWGSHTGVNIGRKSTDTDIRFSGLGTCLI